MFDKQLHHNAVGRIQFCVLLEVPDGVDPAYGVPALREFLFVKIAVEPVGQQRFMEVQPFEPVEKLIPAPAVAVAQADNPSVLPLLLVEGRPDPYYDERVGDYLPGGRLHVEDLDLRLILVDGVHLEDLLREVVVEVYQLPVVCLQPVGYRLPREVYPFP